MVGGLNIMSDIYVCLFYFLMGFDALLCRGKTNVCSWKKVMLSTEPHDCALLSSVSEDAAI